MIVPDYADAAQARDALVGAALLRGETVRDRYDKAVLRLNSTELEEFRAGPLGSGPVRVRCTQVWEIRLPAEHVTLPIHSTYLSAHVPDWPAASDEPNTDVILRPHQDPTALLRLASDDEPLLELTPLPRLRDSGDPEAPLLTVPIVGARPGPDKRWAAVLGGQVVQQAASPFDLLRELASNGRAYDALVSLDTEPWDHTPAGL